MSSLYRFDPSSTGEALSGDCQCERRSSIPLREIQYVGCHYGDMPQPHELEGMPAAARALVLADSSVFIGTDRGMVRNGNDKSMDTRVAHFRDWLISAPGYQYVCCAQSITPKQAIRLIGSYLDHLAKTPYNNKGALRKSDTLSKYVSAAAFFLERTMLTPFMLTRLHGGKSVVDPVIAQRIAHYKKWDTKKPKREPYTLAMFTTFRAKVEAIEARDPSNGFLDVTSLVYDTQTLGIFTGSRVSEYAQSKGSRTAVSRVPARPGTQSSPALPIAFMASDFLFLNRQGEMVPHETLFENFSLAVQLNITFRYDKSGRNYTVRKFGRGSDWLCPIRSAIRLLLRANLLHIPATDPICAFRSPGKSTHQWLHATDVTTTMRAIALETYPDSRHFLHQNVNLFASHSNRVTAAVALSQTGMTIDEIAHRLRWKPESVVFYLRESARDIGAYTANTIAGAHRDFINDR
jgi:hypothetical protein